MHRTTRNTSKNSPPHSTTSTQHVSLHFVAWALIFFGASLQKDASGCGLCGCLKAWGWICHHGTPPSDTCCWSHLKIGLIMDTALPKVTLEHLKTVTHQLAVDRVSFSLVEVDRYRVLVPFSPSCMCFGGGENR